MRLKELLAEVNIDNESGAGSVPFNQNVDYMGLRVKMRPSVFLKLASPLDHEISVDSLVDYIKSGGAIGAPFLQIIIPPEWEEGDFSKDARVRGHEGRNRMMAVQKVEGDDPIEVHLFFAAGVRRRHLTDEMIAKLNKYIIPEEGDSYSFLGPYFILQG